MIIKINDAIVTIDGNPTLERNIQEELDTGKIVIVNTQAERYEMYDKVDITTPYLDVEQYLIQADLVVQVNATEYEHTLSLFENIAFFNTLYPADRSFKLLGQTLEDILTAYQREFAAYHDVNIDWTTIPQAVLDEVIPFKEFAGLNFSSILLSLFRKIWAVPKVNRVGTTWDIYPLYHNAKNNEITKSSISKMSQQNNVDYATKVKSQLKNSVNERTEGEITWFPSASGYVLPRSSSLIKIESNLRYELDSNIISIIKAEAVDILFEIFNIDTGLNEYPTGTFDITSRIIQDEEWDLKPTINSIGINIQDTDNVKNYVRYKVGQPYITNLFEAGTDRIIFDVNTSYLIQAIQRVILLEYNETGNYSDVVIDASIPTDKVKMRFKYIRQRNMDLVHNRKTKGVMNDITTIHQQRDASVEINEYKKNLKLYANRMGNNKNSKTKIFEYPTEPYQLFDYTDEKTIVTRVQNTYHNLWTFCEYEESENFSNIEAEYALMRRTDPYTINAKAVTTNIIKQEFIEFSLTPKALDTRLESDARELLAGLFDNTAIALDKVAVGVFQPVLNGWNLLYAIHMPIESSGDGNLITLHAQFPHQTIAGKTYYDLDTDTLQTYLNPLPYTDADGRLTNFRLYYTPDVLFEDTGEYPLILSEATYAAEAYTTTGLAEPIDLDSAASFAETFQISLVADENMYVGNSLARDNFFVKDQILPAPAIEIWTSTKPYGQYDQAPRSFDTDNTLNITYNYSFANRTITITPSIDVDYFSIVRNDKLLLAVNKSLVSGETYVININYLKGINNDLRLFAKSTTPLSSFSGTALLHYTIRLITASATALSTVSGTGNLVYSERVYALDATTTGLSTVTGTANLIYSERIAVLVATTIDLSNLTGTANLVYTTIDYYLNANTTGLSNVTGTGNLVFTPTVTYTVTFKVDGVTYDTQIVTHGDDATAPTPEPTKASDTTYDYTFNGWDTDFTNVTSNLTVNNNAWIETLRTDVSWIEVETGTVTGGNCDNSLDVGNIKEEIGCVYVGGASYQSSTSLTTPIPACSDGAEYTLCLKISSVPLLFSCVDYVGELTAPVLYECKLDE